MSNVGAASSSSNAQIQPQYMDNFTSVCPPSWLESVSEILDMSEFSIWSSPMNLPSNGLKLFTVTCHSLYSSVFGSAEQDKACQEVKNNQITLAKVDSVGGTILTDSITEGNLDAAKVYALGSNLEQRDLKQTTPLHNLASSSSKSAELLDFFINANVNLDAVDEKGRTPVHVAALFGNTDVLKALIKGGAKVDVKDHNGCSPLLLAAKSSVGSFNLLLEEGASLLTKDKKGAGVWHFAATNPDPASIMATLHAKKIEINIDPNDRDKDRRTAMHYAAECGNLAALDNLVYYGGDVQVASSEKITPIHLAAFYGHSDVIYRLAANHANCSEVDDRGLTPLMLASGRGNLKAVGALLSNKIIVDEIDNKGETALFKASVSNQPEIVAQLLNAGADSNLYPTDGRSARYTAIKLGNKNVAKLLEEAGASVVAGPQKLPLHEAIALRNFSGLQTALLTGADLNALDVDKQTPLMLALATNQEDMTRSLLELNVNVAHVDKNGLTALHLVSLSSFRGVTDQLIAQGASPLAKDQAGSIPLHYAAVTGNCEVIDVLAPYSFVDGMKVDIPNNDGFTPLHLAIQEGRLNAAKHLLDAGANPLVIDNRGLTSLHHAAIRGDVDALKALTDNSALESGINWEDNQGKTPLYYAAVNNCSEARDFLMDKGGLVFQKEQGELQRLLFTRDSDRLIEALSGNSPLVAIGDRPPSEIHNLLQMADSKTATAIVQGVAGKAILNSRDIEQRTILHIVARQGNLEAIAEALEAGVPLESRDASGKTATHYVAENGDLKALELLAMAGANLIAPDAKGFTPLALAIGRGQASFADKISKLGGNQVDNPQKKTSFAFLNMISKGNVDEIQRFINAGAKLDVKDSNGCGAMHYAANSPKAVQIIGMLSTAGLDVGQKDNNDRTALHIATAVNNLALINALSIENKT